MEISMQMWRMKSRESLGQRRMELLEPHKWRKVSREISLRGHGRTSGGMLRAGSQSLADSF